MLTITVFIDQISLHTIQIVDILVAYHGVLLLS
jgi:hypothetical protein